MFFEFWFFVGSLNATYWDRGRFVHYDHVLVHVHNGDWVGCDWDFMPETGTKYVFLILANLHMRKNIAFDKLFFKLVK